MQCVEWMTYDNCKTNNTAVKMTAVQRISKFRKDTWCVKGGWYSLTILHSIKFQFFAHTVPHCTKMCKGLLPQLRVECCTTRIYYECAHICIYIKQVADSWNFGKNDHFSSITLEKSTAGRGCQNALFVM